MTPFDREQLEKHDLAGWEEAIDRVTLSAIALRLGADV
jgi:hypothetical protein